MEHSKSVRDNSISFGLFVEFRRHILPGIHCLLTSKSEEIYTATLANIKELVSQMNPSSAMGENILKPLYTSTLELFTQTKKIIIKKFERYYQNNGYQLSASTSKVTTNNGAESYHAKLNNTFKCNHPNIWYFCDTLNKIITDTDRYHSPE